MLYETMDLTLTETEDTRALIKKYLLANGIKAAWLASKIGVSRHYLSNILSLNRTLSEANKQKINETLKTNF